MPQAFTPEGLCSCVAGFWLTAKRGGKRRRSAPRNPDSIQAWPLPPLAAGSTAQRLFMSFAGLSGSIGSRLLRNDLPDPEVGIPFWRVRADAGKDAIVLGTDQAFKQLALRYAVTPG